ncbi:MAG TPA: WecB/TagA/CpsF family glycosyltransferase [Isosphaeraceae bacterium]|jgi:N-acetylglucosaminyldiphosphoundecaprenol N-acetyl-beta-D-mannosaminyltransferase|nr:WecB/TagA/CpsF family glycosyltransferase [Isosphaeraceae bacterium]
MRADLEAAAVPRQAPRRPAPVAVWGIPLAPVSAAEAVAAIGDLIEAREPSYLVSVNLNYAMLTHRDPRLRAVNDGAALALADGMPLLWAARWRGTPLPERVAGSDLIFALAGLAAERGYGVFLLGGAPGVGDAAAANLRARYPGLRIVGTASPPFRDLTAAEHDELIATIRAARPELLLVAFGQPKGELWVAEHCRALGVPVCAQLGASIDFAAGRVRRAPQFLRRTGLEWAFRLALEPRRLGGRYLRNALFLLGRVPGAVADGLGGRLSRRSASRPAGPAPSDRPRRSSEP